MNTILDMGARQREVVELLWAGGERTVRELRADLPGLAYTTILSTLQALEAGGWVGHRAEGRAHRYRALVSRTEARRAALETLRDRVYGGDAAALARDAVAAGRPRTLKAWVQRRQAAA